MDTETTNIETPATDNPPTGQPAAAETPTEPPPTDQPPTGETPTTDPTPKKLSRAEASRINGAKSRGPVTPEGKARSSQNALKHGLTSRAVVLFNESHEEYDALLLEYRTLYKPMDQYEADRVTDIVNARWRIRRIQRFETAVIDLQLDETSPVLYEKFATIDITAVEAASFQDLVQNSRVLDVIHNYESRYYRILEKAERDLQRYRQTRSQRVSRQVKEPDRPSPSLSFWHRLLPTLLLSILLTSCFSAPKNTPAAPSNFRRIVSLSPPNLRLPVPYRKLSSPLTSHPRAKKLQGRAAAHQEYPPQGGSTAVETSKGEAG
ncbi:MAG: hypothetical protein IT165_25540 [Bryobacterales bacterium]|nr:hypothetical protein [Bryobacterales bacterium]